MEPVTPPPADDPRLRRVVFFSTLAGLTPLVPVPLLDDTIRDAVLRRMVRELAAARGRSLAEHETRALSGTDRPPRSCGRMAVSGCLTVGFKVLQKIFRKVFIFLAIKESADTASRTFHEGYLLDALFADPELWRFVEAGRRPGDDGGPGALGWDAAAVRRVIDATLAAVDPRPIEGTVRRAFRGSGGLLRRAAALLGRRQREHAEEGDGGRRSADPSAVPVAEEEAVIGGLVDRLSDELSDQAPYLEALAAKFRRQMTGA